MTAKADIERVTKLRELLSRFMARVFADGVVRSALRQQGLPEDACPPTRFLGIVDAVRMGLGVLVPEDRLPTLLDELGKMAEDYEAVARASAAFEDPRKSGGDFDGRRSASSGRITLNKRKD